MKSYLSRMAAVLSTAAILLLYGCDKDFGGHSFNGETVEAQPGGTEGDFIANSLVFSISSFSENTVTVVGPISGSSSRGSFDIPAKIKCNGKKYTVTSIQDGAFQSLRITAVNLPVTLKSIGNNAFYQCEKLTSITIPNSVTSIGEFAFFECFSLTSVELGKSVSKIGYSAFYDCFSLTTVYCRPTTPPSLGGNLFMCRTSGDFTLLPNLNEIYVPTESVQKYADWIEYATLIKGYDY